MVCWFVRAFVGFFDVHYITIVTVVRCARDICMRDLIDDQERGLTFELVFIFACCRKSPKRVSCLVLYSSTINDVNVKFR